MLLLAASILLMFALLVGLLVERRRVSSKNENFTTFVAAGMIHSFGSCGGGGG